MLANSEVVIVGGGPIGLAHAWGMKKLNPGIRVVVFEKYEEYQRSHTLVMQHKQLEKLMTATHAKKDPALVELLNQLKKDPHIRTNELEIVFKKLAIEHGVEIVHEEIKKGKLGEQILKHCQNPSLIIGADGTHSVVSESMFGEDNQVKHEFDYVLQLRYDIKGEAKSKPINPIDFYQQMARQGLIANEYVGHFADGATPVTMQMMISKEAFHKLKPATSKKPIKPFNGIKHVNNTDMADVQAINEAPSESTHVEQNEVMEIKEATVQADNDKYKKDVNDVSELRFDEVPDELQQFILTYLEQKIKACHAKEEVIDHSTIRISVNEAPATHAKRVVKLDGDIAVLLAGDAGLGLSYFKGLNAGLESTAKFFGYMQTEIEKDFERTDHVKIAMQKYQHWFLKDFAPRKVKEVESYSTWNIRSLMKIMSVVRDIKMTSKQEDHQLPSGSFKDYFALYPLADKNNKEWRLYPHRPYDLVKLGQFAPIPVRHHLVKIGKIFADYVKPYKSTVHVAEDFKQPLVGLSNIATGIAKIFTAPFTRSGRRLADGVFSLLRGVIEVATTPLSWFIKPVARLIATVAHHGMLKIEENSGMQKLATLGVQNLQAYQLSDKSAKSTYELLAICHDLHRKFAKYTHRGQPSTVSELTELAQYNEIISDNRINVENVKHYFGLFYKKPQPQQRVLLSDNESLIQQTTSVTRRTI